MKWEYLCIYFDSNEIFNDVYDENNAAREARYFKSFQNTGLGTILNRLGSEGWEKVPQEASVLNCDLKTIYFKRKRKLF